MSFILIFLVSACCAVGESIWEQNVVDNIDSVDFKLEFKLWTVEYDKHYISVEDEAKHFKTWISNWKMINYWNTLQNSSYSLGMNQFSDLNSDQLSKTLSTRNMNKQTNYASVRTNVSISDVPSSIDWTNYNGKNYIPQYQNLPACANYGEFALSAIASRGAITNESKVTELSAEELKDCIPGYCNGGTMEMVYKFAQENNGICTAKEYHSSTGACEKSQCNPIDPISGYIDVEVHNSTALMVAVSSGPVVVGVEADQSSFQFYKSGILNGICGDNIDHLLLVVGYGMDTDGNEYWKCQNNWGNNWGEDGFVRICRNCDKNNGAGECGILSMPSYPVTTSRFHSKLAIKLRLFKQK